VTTIAPIAATAAIHAALSVLFVDPRLLNLERLVARSLNLIKLS
jgi:hypothetical protein